LSNLVVVVAQRHPLQRVRHRMLRLANAELARNRLPLPQDSRDWLFGIALYFFEVFAYPLTHQIPCWNFDVPHQLSGVGYGFDGRSRVA
jgi:hypothetical protein